MLLSLDQADAICIPWPVLVEYVTFGRKGARGLAVNLIALPVLCLLRHALGVEHVPVLA